MGAKRTMERTLVIIKPDAVQRGIVGEIISRFEKAGMKIIGAKFVTASKDLLNKHYPVDREDFVVGLGKNTLNSYREMGLKPLEQFGHQDPVKIGRTVRGWLVEFMASGPVLALVIEGPHAIEIVRKLVGSTLPQKSAPGTIRGDYSFDSSYLANTSKRSIHNLIHASGSPKEAEFEINLWFKDKEMHNYHALHQRYMVDQVYE